VSRAETRGFLFSESGRLGRSGRASRPAA